MKFIFSIKDQNINTLQIEINQIISEVKYNQTTLDTLATEELFSFLSDYKDNSYASNISYSERKLLLQFPQSKNNSNLEELLRTFACSMYLFHFRDNENIEKSIYDKINDKRFHVFDNNFFVDWTGYLGTQPSVYYLSLTTTSEKSSEIQKLFDLGFLGKLEFSYNDLSQYFYFIPIKKRNISKFSLLPFNSTITRILNEREQKYQGINK